MQNRYTCNEVANITGLSPKSVKVYAHRYQIGQRHGRDWFFTDEDIVTIRSRIGKRGRPKAEE